MTWPATLKLRGWAPKLEGSGSELVLRLEATKPKRRNKYAWSWRGVVLIEVDRYFVRQLAEAVAEMQVRDRERLARETRRLTTEVEPITGKQPTEEK